MHAFLCPAIFLTIASLSVAYSGDLMLTMVNKERARYGLGPLRLNKHLTKAAKMHSKNQATYKRHSQHVGTDGSRVWDRCERYGYPTKRCAENVAWNYSDEADCMSGWMKSQGHRENILSTKYSEFGSAVAYDSDNTPYYTQVFGNPNAYGNDDDSQYSAPSPKPRKKYSGDYGYKKPSSSYKPRRKWLRKVRYSPGKYGRKYYRKSYKRTTY